MQLTGDNVTSMQPNKLSSPWESLHHMLEAFFLSDTKIVISKCITDNYVLDVIVYDKDKFTALSKILITKYEFGNVTLRIKISLNSAKKADPMTFFPENSIECLGKVLYGNNLFDHIETQELMGSTTTYCMFTKVVVQYYDDNLADPHGVESTLAQHIAEQIFDVKDVFYCTEVV